MALWANNDTASGANKPKWSNTANTLGANTAEVTNRAHGISPGWIEVLRGKGPISLMNLFSGGANINSTVFGTSAGFLSITGGMGGDANISYGINNVSNTVNTVTIVRGGSYTNTPSILIVGVTAADQPKWNVGFSGRFNRNNYDQLVFVKAMGTSDSDDFFS